jgi:hypothetical protein
MLFPTEPGRPSMNKICGRGKDVCIEVLEITLAWFA